ncbi:hypothetical protein EW146_g70 [Bondarzewia mesenterica]|uniref:MIT domain-containing protein n=1 Tax=Bondarzewia mesenterica TaxID=1095465 RepID=A0A4S4M822_9AGAM|nr:hypothetical protein EW146_g70 [Bondarzewia mesenterica]
MQLGESRPSSVLSQTRDWQPRSNMDPGPSSPAPLPASFIPSTSVAQRRRSSALHVPPPAPPPNQPIPSVPILDTTPSEGSKRLSDYGEVTYHNGVNSLGPFARPAASPGLAAVAAFSQARLAAASQPFQPSATSFYNGIDSPPQPITRPTNSGHLQDIIPDRLLLSPPEQSSAEPRPSSRRALTKALELAREAVKLDSTNDDPYGAVVAYGKSVALLSKVMERVMRGEDSTESHRRRGGRRRSVVAQEEEVKRLKAIHDTYADRMNILSLIYSIPPIPHSPSSLYTASISASTDSTQPSSPVSGSPTSDSSDQTPTTLSLVTDDDSDSRRFSQETTVKIDGIFPMDESEPSDLVSTSSVHPYAAASMDRQSHPSNSESNHPPSMSRASMIPPARPPPTGPPPLRPRAVSALPPAAPPPQTSLPPAPDQHPLTNKHLTVISRPRGNSAGHVRSGSGSRLESLKEEGERYDDRILQTQQQHHLKSEDEFRRPRAKSILQSQRELNRESHPLPPLPSPSEAADDAPATPRTLVNDHEQLSPPSSAKHITPRPRGISTVSARSEIVTSTTLINASTTMGTISQRRSKASAPPSVTGSPNLSDSAPPSSMKMTASGLPVSSAQNIGYGRSRAASQPGRRPSLSGLPSSSLDLPGRPSSSMISIASMPRKVSGKIGSQLPQITVVTGLMSPPLSIPATQLVPPPPIPPSNLPTTPTSPLPPAPPPDPLRKPYHMMNLIRHTMTSKSGGYITRRLHVPHEVWSQGGAKLVNLPEKVRVVEVLCSALEEVQNTSVDIFGAGNVSSGMAMGIGSIGKKEGDIWSAKLEEFSAVCDGVVANFGKKLGVGEGFVTKKSSGVTSWGGKLTRQFDKFTNGKNLDSPASYVQGLSRLFLQAQLLDEHSKAVSMQPVAPSYAALPIEVRAAIESKLRRASEFFATVVLTFVIRDLAQLLDKYVKKCEKWLAE